MRTVDDIKAAAERALDEARLEFAQLADTAVTLEAQAEKRRQADAMTCLDLGTRLEQYECGRIGCDTPIFGPKAREALRGFGVFLSAVPSDVLQAWDAGLCPSCAEKGES